MGLACLFCAELERAYDLLQSSAQKLHSIDETRWASEAFHGIGLTLEKLRRFDAASDAILAATTEGEAYDRMWEAEAILAEQLPYVVLFDTPITEFFSNELSFPFIQTLSGLQFGSGFAGLVQK